MNGNRDITSIVKQGSPVVECTAN